MFTGNLTYGTITAAVEAMTQRLAVELGPSGVRVVCLRPHAIFDGPANGSFAGETFGPRAAAAGLSVEQWFEQWAEDVTLLGRLPTLAQVADAAVFVASDLAATITGTVVDLTSGNAVRTKPGHWLVSSTRPSCPEEPTTVPSAHSRHPAVRLGRQTAAASDCLRPRGSTPRLSLDTTPWISPPA